MDQNSFSGEDPVSPTQKTEEQVTTPSSLISEPHTTLLPLPKRRVSPWMVVAVIVVITALVLLYIFRGVFIAAMLDGQPISRLAVVRELEKQSGAQVLDALINQLLIEQKAAEAGIVVSDEDIEKALAAIQENLTSQNVTLEEALKAQNLTLAQLKESIKFQKLAEKLVEDRVSISEEDINAYMQENKDLLPDAGSEDEQRAIVRDMLRQQKFSSAFQEWLTMAKAESNVSYWKEY